MANAPTVTGKMIDKGIKKLLSNNYYDSAVSTSVYNMWSPLRARKLKKDGTLKPICSISNIWQSTNFKL